MIEVKNLDIGYHHDIVIENIDFQIEKGEMVSILGANGCGKTTFIKTLSRMLPKINGEIWIDGKEISHYTDKEYAEKVALVLTDRMEPSLFKVHEIVALGRYPYTDFFGKLSGKDKEIIRRSIELVGAEKLANRYMSELSDGERQKVMIARALAQDTDIIIMDEPTIHLDINHKVELVSIIRNLCLKENKTVFASLHEIDLALKNCDKVLLAKDGKILNYGSPETVIGEKTIDQIYDIKKATYNRTIGNMEWKNKAQTKDILVIAGNGTGIDLFRMMNKLGVNCHVGMLSKNDIDYHIANTIGFEILANEAYMPLTESEKNHMLDVLAQKSLVIDTGVAIGDYNQEVYQLIEAAKVKNMPIYCLGEKRAVYEKYPLVNYISIEDIYRYLKNI